MHAISKALSESQNISELRPGPNLKFSPKRRKPGLQKAPTNHLA